MALSTISGTTGITDATITSAKLADFAAAVDLNGVELILDADQDTSITADTDDRIDFKIAGVEHISISNSSGDTIIKPMVDVKDIIFQQYDGNKILEINDGNFVGIGGNATAAGEIRIYEDTDNGSHYTGFKAGNNTASVAYVLPTADGTSGHQLTTDGSGTLSWSSAGVSLANDANNRVVTADGSGGINGEANLTFDGSTLTNAGATQLNSTLTVGANDQGYDVILYGDTASANMTWDTSADDLIFNGAARIVIPDGQLVLGSTAVTSTAAELNLLDNVSGLVQADLTKLAAIDSTAAELNIVDGGTSATSTTVADADRVVLNDNGTMVQVAVTDLAAYFDDEITAMPNLVTTAATTVGALDSGSITSGFGAIDNGTSNIRSATITAETAFVPDAADGATLGTTSLEFSDLFLADGGQVLFGADQDVTLTHVADSGLALKSIATSDDKPITLVLQTGETDIAANDVLGALNFQAPDEGTGTDAILVAAGIAAVSEGDFSSSNNATKLSFRTAASEAASEKMSLSSAGLLTVSDDIVFKDGGTIGVSSATDAMTVSSGGIVTFKDDILIKDGGTIGSASDADAITIAANGVTTFSQAPVFPDGSIAVADLDIDGATDIGADIVDADLFIVDDGAGGTNRKMAASRLKTYVGTAGRATLIDTITLSNSATAVFDSSDITGYDNYLITVENVITGSGNIELLLYVSVDNGSNYLDSSGDYRFISFNGIENESNNSFTSRYSASTNKIGITGNYANNGNDAALKIDATVECFSLTSTSYKKFIIRSMFGQTDDPPKLVYEHNLAQADTQTAVNNLKIQASSGTLASGKIKLFGLA